MNNETNVARRTRTSNGPSRRKQDRWSGSDNGEDDEESIQGSDDSLVIEAPVVSRGSRSRPAGGPKATASSPAKPKSPAKKPAETDDDAMEEEEEEEETPASAKKARAKALPVRVSRGKGKKEDAESEASSDHVMEESEQEEPAARPRRARVRQFHYHFNCLRTAKEIHSECEGEGRAQNKDNTGKDDARQAREKVNAVGLTSSAGHVWVPFAVSSHLFVCLISCICVISDCVPLTFD